MKNFVKQMWHRCWGKKETPAKVEVDPALVKYGEKVINELVGKPELSVADEEGVSKLIAATSNVKIVDDEPAKFRPKEPVGVKCGLPGCNVLTLHNGGYCCADHCREHRAQQKRKSA